SPEDGENSAPARPTPTWASQRRGRTSRGAANPGSRQFWRRWKDLRGRPLGEPDLFSFARAHSDDAANPAAAADPSNRARESQSRLLRGLARRVDAFAAQSQRRERNPNRAEDFLPIQRHR